MKRDALDELCHLYRHDILHGEKEWKDTIKLLRACPFAGMPESSCKKLNSNSSENLSRTEKRIEFFKRFCSFYLECHRKGIKLCPHSFYRTTEEQRRLFDTGLTKCDGTTKRSLHQDWLAIDVFPYEDDKAIWDNNHPHYEEMMKIAARHGIMTGRGFKDSGHIQWRE